MSQRHVYLGQIANAYGKSVFLPYSVGSLWAYVQTIPAIREAYHLKGFLVRRDPIAEVVDRLEKPAVLGLSCYTWNWNYSLALAHAVKAAYPECLTVLGGPHVPDDATGVLLAHPSVDIVVHGEGEITFAAVLQAWLRGPPEDWQIAGLTRRHQHTPPRARLTDLSVLPSPYTTGVFDELMREPLAWLPTIETNRGCPYSCAFCEWGSATQTKTKLFPEARVLAEIEWCAAHRIRYICCADANFGMMPRDLTIAEALAKHKTETGWPQEFHATYAKNATDRVYAISRLLNDAQMCKGVTMSFQSLDPHTLEAVKRSNIKLDRFESQLQRYHEAGIPTYTEMILPLPDETLESYTRGLCQLLEAGQHQGITVYQCRLLPNTEMSAPTYRERYGLQTVMVESLPQHSVPHEDADAETEELVVATQAMPPDEWLQAWLFTWAVQTFHGMGLTRLLALYLRQEQGLSYQTFYKGVLSYAAGQMVGVIGAEYERAWHAIKGEFAGRPRGIVLPQFGSIVWPIEEAAFLMLVTQKSALMRELLDVGELLRRQYGLEVEPSRLEDLIRYNTAMVRDPYMPETFLLECDHDWIAYFAAIDRGEPQRLNTGAHLLTVKNETTYAGDLEAYAREHVWYGRKTKSYFYTSVMETHRIA